MHRVMALLLSAAPSPPDAPEPRLLAPRLLRLLAMGGGAAALALIGSLPQGEQDRDEIRRLRLRAHLAEGERGPACALIRTALRALEQELRIARKLRSDFEEYLVRDGAPADVARVDLSAAEARAPGPGCSRGWPVRGTC